MTGPSADGMETLLRQLGVRGAGGINPEESQLVALVETDYRGPLQFVNLLAFRERAIYPAGHELAGAGLSGADAYGRYGEIALEQVGRHGGRLILYNDVHQALIGQMRQWDQILVIEFTGTSAFVDMIRDRDYQASLVHRDAGLAEVVILITQSVRPS